MSRILFYSMKRRLNAVCFALRITICMNPAKKAVMFVVRNVIRDLPIFKKKVRSELNPVTITVI